ncbi:hypothetical protein ACL9X9_001774 [Campylobacter jejuni]
MNIDNCWSGTLFSQNVKDTINNLKNSEKKLEKIQETNDKQNIQLTQNTQKEEKLYLKNKDALLDIIA